MRAAEARAIVCDDFARDLRRALKAIAAVATEQHAEQRRHYRSFEAELERAKRNGIREVIPMVRADFHLSLTGGSLG
jgi:predicted phage gp36 major capsid-like protein